MQTLYQAYLAAEQTALAIEDQLLDCQDETRLTQLEAEREPARIAVDTARQNLIQSDELRVWVLADDEGEVPLATVELRPSEVESRLRAEVIAANSDGLLQTLVVKGYAACDATGEQFTIEVTLEPAAEDDNG